MTTTKIWNLFFSLMYLVSVYPMDRAIENQSTEKYKNDNNKLWDWRSLKTNQTFP